MSERSLGGMEEGARVEPQGKRQGREEEQRACRIKELDLIVTHVSGRSDLLWLQGGESLEAPMRKR